MGNIYPTSSSTPPLLRYGFITNPFPLQAGPSGGASDPSSLTIVVTNGTGSDVTLQGFIIQVPVGDGAAQLTANADSIKPIYPQTWQLKQRDTPTGFVRFLFVPAKGSEVLQDNQSLNFIFNSILVNSETGTCQVDVTEGSSQCTPPNCPVTSLFVTKFPNGWGRVMFNATPPIIPSGQNTVLSWKGPQGATYTIQYYTPQSGIVNVPQPGQPPLANEASYPGQGQPLLILTQDTTFYLLVSQTIGGQTASSQFPLPVTVIPQLQIESFASTANNFSAAESITLSWRTQAALACNMQIKGCSGSLSVGVANDTMAYSRVYTEDGKSLKFVSADGAQTFGTIPLPYPAPASVDIVLTASNAEGSLQSMLTITLRPCVINSYTFQIIPSEPSEQCELHWATTDSFNNSISSVGAVAPSGHSHYLSLNNHYTLTCNGFGGPKQSTVNP